MYSNNNLTTTHWPTSSAADSARHDQRLSRWQPGSACLSGLRSAPCARQHPGRPPTTQPSGCACCCTRTPCRLSGTACWRQCCCYCCCWQHLRASFSAAGRGLGAGCHSCGSPDSSADTCLEAQSSGLVHRHRSLVRPTCCWGVDTHCSVRTGGQKATRV